MAIYAVGFTYQNPNGAHDRSSDFLTNGIVCIGWDITDAPDLHNLMKTFQTGDIVYLKKWDIGSSSVFVRAIGFIKDEEIKSPSNLDTIGRNVVWKFTDPKGFTIKPDGKNNVRTNSIYQEFDPIVQKAIFKNI